jgi:hypothetical protein
MQNGWNVIDPSCVVTYYSAFSTVTELSLHLLTTKASSRWRVPEVYPWSPTSGDNIPKSTWCIGSRMSFWCTQKCWIFQNALQTRWARGVCTESFVVGCIRAGWVYMIGCLAPVDNGVSGIIRWMTRPFPTPARIVSRRLSWLDLDHDANTAVDMNSFLFAVQRWQVWAGSHVKASLSWDMHQISEMMLYWE